MMRALHLADPALDQPPTMEGRLLPVGVYPYPPIGGAAEDEIRCSDDLAAHHRRFGERPEATGLNGTILLGLLDEVGLAGSGGGHFPVARKWRTALKAGGGGIVVANGAESEPASVKDRALLCTIPHLVIDGLVSAAEALGASELVIWLHADASDARRAVSGALAERRAHRYAEPEIRLVLAPSHYLSGESSAILRTLTGGPTLPQFSRRPAAADGYFGSPAVVHNVETLARIGLLARSGVRRHQTSTMLTVCTRHARTAMEVEPGTTIGAAVCAGGWLGAAPQAVLFGGYGGSWLPWSAVADVLAEESALVEVGASLGAGVLIPLGRSECGVSRTADIASFMADASARQCGPCRFGLASLAELLQGVAAGTAGRDAVRRLDTLRSLIDGRGGCHHPDGVVRMVASALATFESDVARHVRGLSCEATDDTLTKMGPHAARA